MPATIALERCPACREPDAQDVRLGVDVVLRRCRACETVYAPEYADPDEIYDQGYYTGGRGRFGLDVRHPRFQRFLLDVGAQRGRLLEALAGAPGSLLDVGCGTGEFLSALRERGWRVTGVEPIEESARTARERGLDVITGMLEDSGLSERSFDVVSALHVLEHVSDVTAFVAMLARYARPGGHVAVEVPNYGSRLRRREGAEWLHLRPLEHLTHFEPRTLAGVLERAGLQPVAVRAPTWESRDHTLEEALRDSGRTSWGRFLAPVSPRRPVEGEPVRVPGAIARAVLRAARALDDRRGLGMVLLAVARVPGGP